MKTKVSRFEEKCTNRARKRYAFAVQIFKFIRAGIMPFKNGPFAGFVCDWEKKQNTPASWQYLNFSLFEHKFGAEGGSSARQLVRRTLPPS